MEWGRVINHGIKKKAGEMDKIMTWGWCPSLNQQVEQKERASKRMVKGGKW
mgnify:CR=1 FL=1